MRILLVASLSCLFPLLAIAQVPWKAHAGVGVALPDGPSAVLEPFVEASAFVRVLDPAPPEFFQAGGRLAWDPRGLVASLGVRHKMYLLPWSSSGQEVLVGRRFRAEGGAWTLSGRFGVGLPWLGRDGDLPSGDVDLVWGVDWTPERGFTGSLWGLALGLGGGEARQP